MRALCLCLGLLCLFGQNALAQDTTFPARHEVFGVAADDMLNVRVAPDSSAEVIGALGPNEIGIEVLRLSNDGAWGRIALGEQSGWVSMRFLVVSEYVEANRPIRCLGNEPFWSLQIGSSQVVFDAPDNVALGLATIRESTSGLNSMSIFLSEGGTAFTTIINRSLCSDGMSDREYGFRSTMFVESPGGNQLLTGCCTLDLR